MSKKTLNVPFELNDNFQRVIDELGNATGLQLKKDEIKHIGNMILEGDLKVKNYKKLYLNDNIYLQAAGDFVTFYVNNEYMFRLQLSGSNSYAYLRDAQLVLNDAGTTSIASYTDSGEDYLYFIVGGQTIMRMREGTYEEAEFSHSIALAATKKLYFDGGGAGDTYITEFGADDLRLYVGNVLFFKMIQDDSGDDYIEMENTHLHMGAEKKLFFDGGSDTYIYESSADRLELVAGGEVQIRMTENGGGAADTILLNSTVSAAQDIKLTNGKKLYIDGGFNTYIYQNGDGVMEFFCDDDLILKLVEGGANGNLVYLGDAGVGFTQFEPTYNAADTDVDFNTSGNKAFLTFGAGNIGDLNLSFPNASCNCQLVIKQDGTGGRTIAADGWLTTDQSGGNAGTVKWPGGSPPTLSTGANAVDIISFYWDNDNHTAYGVASLNFS